jgi:putative oxidoreductase
MKVVSTTTAPTVRHGVLICAAVMKALSWLEAVPYAALALPLRVGAAAVFWNSAMSKLANWDTTLMLFEEEYKVPLLPPEVAANMALMNELVFPPLLVLGLFTRPAAAALLAMTAVIQVFVYPGSWPTHIQWTAMLLVLLCRGPGPISIDYFLRRWLFGNAPASAKL